jgi:hypothetical protein
MMNTTDIQTNNSGSGNWIVFLFGAVFNLIVTIDYQSHIDYAIHMLVAGLVWLLFKKLGEMKISPRKKSNVKRLLKKKDGKH